MEARKHVRFLVHLLVLGVSMFLILLSKQPGSPDLKSQEYTSSSEMKEWRLLALQVHPPYLRAGLDFSREDLKANMPNAEVLSLPLIHYPVLLPL